MPVTAICEVISADARKVHSSKHNKDFEFKEVQAVITLGSDRTVGDPLWPRGADLPIAGATYELDYGFDSYQGKVRLVPVAARLKSPAKPQVPFAPAVPAKA